MYARINFFKDTSKHDFRVPVYMYSHLAINYLALGNIDSAKQVIQRAKKLNCTQSIRELLLSVENLVEVYYGNLESIAERTKSLISKDLIPRQMFYTLHRQVSYENLDDDKTYQLGEFILKQIEYLESIGQVHADLNIYKTLIKDKP